MKFSLPKVFLNKRDWMLPTVKLRKRDKYSIKKHITKRASNVFLTKLDWMLPSVKIIKLDKSIVETFKYVKSDQEEEPAPPANLHRNEQVKIVFGASVANNANKENNNADPKSSEHEYENSHIGKIEMPEKRLHRRSNYRNYDIDDLNSDDSTDDEDEPKKKIPAWAKGKLLASAAREQLSMDPDQIFSSVDISDLSNVFLTNRPGVSGITKL